MLEWDKRPRGLEWRSSETFITCVVDFSIFSDLVLYSALVPVFPFALTDRVGIPEDRIQTSVSHLLAVYALGALVTTPIIGYLSDRASSRRVHYLFGLFALILTTVLVGIARTYWLLVLGRVLQGCSSAVVWTVGMAVLADTLPTEQLGFAMGTIGSIEAFAMVAAPFLGGTIFDQFGFEAVFYFLGILLLIDIILRLLMIERADARKWGIGLDSEIEDDESQPLLNNEAEKPPPKSLLRLLTSPRFLTAAWIALVCGSIYSGPFDAALPLHLKRIFDFNALTTGAAFGALSVPEIILGPLSGSLVDRKGPKLVAVIGFAWICLSLFSLVIPTGPAGREQIAALVAVLIFNGCAMALIEAPAMTEITMQLRTDAGGIEGHGYAQGYGWFNVAWFIGTLVGPLIAGWIVETWNWDVLCYVMGTVAAITLIPILLFTGGKKKDTTG